MGTRVTITNSQIEMDENNQKYTLTLEMMVKGVANTITYKQVFQKN